ncbi:LacI family transcriptional regulator [Mesorhizobium sp. B3-1-9]|uniref:LacI family DNA-binding transcriptional regulator n=1 Tax=unclassified Mesorhizobium TaxID=325217 RepID=UPI00112CBA34|nr:MULTISPECIES: LacI family DNA-binding transcriptional regulator [unclassified Mesorhizobium]TPI38169.1 LacI family transcriptional regulator [Mesorhizobium sp. B3-1-9]TPI44385.1 LacI family transcriptional regulator [Mesorhizobium sp. B3-1-6]TPI59050.1 LacI family transcriptional regulator [Mesorhizobium sp. B3-1-7]UCI28544.1 LacI family DNA-binding transcriptional regulator [Mesorhizobium sp. B2-8-5]
MSGSTGIDGGSVRKGIDKPATIRDVARVSGVSVGTVSRSLNAPDTVRPGTLGKVRAAIHSLGFQPDSRAQNMRRRNTMTVGFVIDDIANPWHASCFKAVDSQMRERGFSLYLMSTNGRASDEAAAIDMLQHGRADGMILTINNEQDPRTIKRLKELRVPSVLLDRDIPLEIDAVLTEHATGLRQATGYLIELGHRRIAIITAGKDIRPGRERVRGFVEAFQKSGLAVPEHLIRSQSLSADFGFREATALLQMRERPTAIIAAGNRILVGVLRALQQQGVSVPNDISLIGCDRSDVAMLYPGPITLIDRPVEEIGRTAALLLLERLGGQADRPAQRISFPTHLILGGSCRPVSD